MKLYDVTDLAVRNLRESIFRNSLTTVGISVGVASLVAMLSLGIGLQQLASKRLEKLPHSLKKSHARNAVQGGMCAPHIVTSS